GVVSGVVESVVADVVDGVVDVITIRSEVATGVTTAAGVVAVVVMLGSSVVVLGASSVWQAVSDNTVTPQKNHRHKRFIVFIGSSSFLIFPNYTYYIDTIRAKKFGIF
ncbi:MAG: hypothetical protein IKC99_04415, partial [Clostridia bacterium]|nr:hypothetical protein [Clostridia bacterium]